MTDGEYIIDLLAEIERLKAEVVRLEDSITEMKENPVEWCDCDKCVVKQEHLRERR